MEAFESFVALALEEDGFVVSPAVKFPVRRRVRKASRVEFQEHGYEVDIVAARADRLLLATVKSFLGSGGVAAETVTGKTDDRRRAAMYRLLNDPVIRAGSSMRRPGDTATRDSRSSSASTSGGSPDLAPASTSAGSANGQRPKRVGSDPIVVVGLDELVGKVRRAAERRQYRDNAALVPVKVLAEAGQLVPLGKQADGKGAATDAETDDSEPAAP
jgi:hypothetical protein